MRLRKYSLFVSILVLLSVLLSGCTGGATTIATSWPGLFVDQETAYVAYNTRVYAVNIANGGEIWRYPAEANNKTTFYAPPVLTSDNQLIVSAYDNKIHSIDATNGSEKWLFNNAKNRFIGSPLVTDDTIFASGTDNFIYALGLKGNLLWSLETDGEQWAQPVLDPDGSKLYVSSMDHNIYAIDMNGHLIWKTQESLGGAIVGSPAIGPNKVMYVGSFGSQMTAINTDTGEIIWKVPTDGWIWSGPNLKDNVLYFGDLKNSFYALNAENGNTLWKNPTDGPVVDTPLLTENEIFFGSEIGTLYCLDYQGNVTWQKNIDAKIYQSPVLAGDLLILAPVAKESILIAYDMNGVQKWNFVPAK